MSMNNLIVHIRRNDHVQPKVLGIIKLNDVTWNNEKKIEEYSLALMTKLQSKS